MITKKIFFLIYLIFTNIFFIHNLKAEFSNKILVKVGEEIITTLDLQNEILTSLIINKQEINQANINQIKDFSLKYLINKKIKKIEINKYSIQDYNKNDLNNYLNNIATNSFNTNIAGLKDIFKKNNISYETFLLNYEIELLWNSLIFIIYKNQLNINIIDVENELNNLKENKTEIEITELKKKIINQKKQEKLNLFSRSHFSNLENSITINFQ